MESWLVVDAADAVLVPSINPASITSTTLAKPTLVLRNLCIKAPPHCTHLIQYHTNTIRDCAERKQRDTSTVGSLATDSYGVHRLLGATSPYSLSIKEVGDAIHLPGG